MPDTEEIIELWKVSLLDWANAVFLVNKDLQPTVGKAIIMYLAIFDENINFLSLIIRILINYIPLLGQKNLSDEDIQKYFLEVF
jgi:hypothetical protein